jgi:hypothetical protein
LSLFKGNPSPVHQPRAPPANTASSPAAIFVGIQANAITTQASVNNQPAFDPMSFMQQYHAQTMAAVQQKSQTIVVESCEDRTCESEAKFNNNMLQLLLIGGIVDFLSPGSFTVPRIAKYSQAMKNILLQPTSVRSISTVNILTTVFNEIPDDMAKRLSPLTTHKSMHHILKNFASSLLSCKFQWTNLDSLSYKTNSITV